MEKTVLNVKIDRNLKEGAQDVAREIGLPLGTIINAYLRDFVREKRVIFSVPPAPNRKLQALLRQVRSGAGQRGRRSRPLTYEEAVRHLDAL